jgi:hypothetical protein
MARYNKNFELSVEDMDLIETALRNKMRAINEGEVKVEAEDKSLRRINELLGRLHNQKVFYRPQQGSYIGG